MTVRAFFAFVFLTAALPLKAELVTFEARGHMTQGEAQDFAVDDKFVATITLDLAAPPLSTPVYLDAQYQNVRAWQFVFERGYVFTGTYGFTGIANNNVDPPSPAFDIFVIRMDSASSIGIPLPSGRPFNFLQIDLQDSEPLGNPDLMNGITMPATPPSLSLTSFPNDGRLVYYEPGILPGAEPYFALESFVAVPEPSTFALLAIGGILLHRIRRH